MAAPDRHMDAPATWLACPELADLAAIHTPGVQLCRHPRRPPAELRTLVPIPARNLRFDVAAGDPFPDLPLPEGQARRILSADAAFLAGLLHDLTGCPRLGLRLVGLSRAMCPRFHTDRVGLRLLCTYRGPGTQWLDDQRYDRRRLPAQPAGANWCEADAFDIVLLKGAAWPGNEHLGAIHRSPDPGGAPRALLSIDAIW